MQNEEWRWSHQHDHSTNISQCITHILCFQSRMDSRDGIISMTIPLTCHISQLTSYDIQCRMEGGDGIISMTIPPTCHNAQLTAYDIKSRMENGDWNYQHDHSSNMPQYTTHLLWFPMQDEEWRWVISMTIPLTCHNAQLTAYDFQCMVESKDGVISMTILPTCHCTTHSLWFPM